MNLKGLYLIADTGLLARHNPTADLARLIESLIQAGVSIVQLRDKSSLHNPTDKKYQLATTLLGVCRSYQVPFLVNDDVALAIEIGADGVHLGEIDMPIRTARQQLGADKYIGASCYASTQRAHDAAEQGADYVAFGSVYASTTKAQATQLCHAGDSKQSAVEQLRQLSRASALPVCAIGGITPDNAKAVVDCGVQMIAVASGILAKPNPQQATRLYLSALKGSH